jgi:AAA domain
MLFPIVEETPDFSKLSKLIYSFPKTGKSTFASFMRDKDGRPPLFIATEDGHKALKVHAVKTTAWEGFLRLLQKLEEQADQLRKEHSCFILDLVSDLDDMCTQHICQTNYIKTLADMEHGKGWALHKQEFRAGINRLFNLMPVTFICHGSEKEVMWNNEKIKIQFPSMTKSCMEYVNGKVDIIMWISPANSKKEYPEIVMQNTTTCVAGSRFPQLVRNFPYYPDKPLSTYQEIERAYIDGQKQKI